MEHKRFLLQLPRSTSTVRSAFNVSSVGRVKLVRIAKTSGQKTSSFALTATKREKSISSAKYANASGLMILFKKLMKEL